MTRNTITLLALGASLLTAGYALGQNKKSDKAAPAAPAQQQQTTKLVRIATLENAQANREFTANVQLVQAQRQLAVELSSKIEAEKDSKKKDELKKQLDAVMKKLQENNDLMQKTYGFSITRNYIMEVERSHIYLQVTDEEAAKLEKAEKDAKAKGKK